MSSALAIASVTYLLKDLLNDGLILHDVSSSVTDAVTVTAFPPDTINLADKNQFSSLNLFMYQATPNPGWRNVGLPSRDSRGDRVTNPPLALDLHYLLTAYGFDELHSEILLGYGMQILHETPGLSREGIRSSLAAPDSAVHDPKVGNTYKSSLPDKLKKLAESALADQIEQIKITLQPMGTEEMSKLWTAFQSKYRPSAAYTVSVVLIESRRSTRSALPVRERFVVALPFRQPVIDEIFPQMVSRGETVTIRGRNLKSPDVTVRIGGKEVAPPAAKTGNEAIEVTVPDGVRAGIIPVKVVQGIDLRTPKEPHKGYESNTGVFILRPVVTVDLASVSGTVTERSVTTKSGKLTVNFTPEVGRDQKVAVKLNQIPGGAGSGYCFNAPAGNGITDATVTKTAAVTFSFDRVLPGTYLVRAEVDGAESVLTTDITGHFSEPKVTI
jgi:hypothetical protein